MRSDLRRQLIVEVRLAGGASLRSARAGMPADAWVDPRRTGAAARTARVATIGTGAMPLAEEGRLLAQQPAHAPAGHGQAEGDQRQQVADVDEPRPSRRAPMVMPRIRSTERYSGVSSTSQRSTAG